ncbi:EamA family transporter [Loktanella sp. D2R18]|uniref:DMT family transporter n=1 Tax=Rhodobacterales TaxID=204455 RepID=UPI000DEBBDBD|nr:MULTISPECIES: DMT family transporter [Rhodobacterales]MDO6589564.1 DMT family transporter [Yoonia sp. 1_MG-2023]RBW44205.1 EamA family transporter [Loktanella sp. D2R18]
MNNTLKAGLWMLAAIGSFTSMAVAGRAVSADLDTFEIMLFRSVTGIILVLLVAAFSGNFGQITRNRFGLHLVRNLCHFTGQNLWFFAIATIPLAQVFALEFTTPIWVILLSPLVLRDKLTPVGLLSAIIGFLGVLIVTRPDTATLSPGLIAAAICAIFFALTAIFTRKLTITEPITAIMFYLTASQAVFGLLFAGYDGDITLPSGAGIPLVILIGFAGLFAHFCLTTALSLAPPSIVMPFDFIRLPTIAVAGMVLYGEPLEMLVFVGAALIFGANYLNISYGTRTVGSDKK